MTTHEEQQLAVLVSVVDDLKTAVLSLEKRLIGGNGDGLIVRLRLIEERVASRLWWEHVFFGGVVLLVVERLWDLVTTAPPGAPLAVPL